MLHNFKTLHTASSAQNYKAEANLVAKLLLVREWQNNSFFHSLEYLPRYAMHSATYAVSVRLSYRLSHSFIVASPFTVVQKKRANFGRTVTTTQFSRF